MPLPPFPVNPAPGTWNSGNPVETELLRGGPGNAALLLAYKPTFSGYQLTTGQSVGTGPTSVTLDTELADAWDGHTPGQATYRIPFDGWYLTEFSTEYTAPAATTDVVCGIQTSTLGASINRDGGRGCGNGSSPVGVCAAELAQGFAANGDTISGYGFASVSTAITAGSNGGARFKTEWVANNDAPTVVASPVAAALWPPGAGTTITNAGGIAAGATSMTVASATGMVIGGTLGLDYLNGAQTAAGAEKVTITSIAGLTIGISATAYSHAQTAPVAVPLSAAWMNQQVRDAISFLTYPPIANLNTSGTAGTLATGGTGIAITFTTAAVDNFTGWNGTNAYTFPVGGVYYVFGQVYLAQHATFEAAAGLSYNGGAAMWGTTQRNTSATSNFLCATVRRHLRVTAGSTVKLMGYQNSGSALALEGSGQAFCKLIVVWRGF